MAPVKPFFSRAVLDRDIGGMDVGVETNLTDRCHHHMEDDAKHEQQTPELVGIRVPPLWNLVFLFRVHRYRGHIHTVQYYV